MCVADNLSQRVSWDDCAFLLYFCETGIPTGLVLSTYFESGSSLMMAGLLSEDMVQVHVLHQLAMRMGGKRPILVWSLLWIWIRLIALMRIRADLDSDFYLMQIRIRVRLFTLMRIRIRISILASK